MAYKWVLKALSGLPKDPPTLHAYIRFGLPAVRPIGTSAGRPCDQKSDQESDWRKNIFSIKQKMKDCTRKLEDDAMELKKLEDHAKGLKENLARQLEDHAKKSEDHVKKLEEETLARKLEDDAKKVVEETKERMGLINRASKYWQKDLAKSVEDLAKREEDKSDQASDDWSESGSESDLSESDQGSDGSEEIVSLKHQVKDYARALEDDVRKWEEAEMKKWMVDYHRKDEELARREKLLAMDKENFAKVEEDLAQKWEEYFARLSEEIKVLI